MFTRMPYNFHFEMGTVIFLLLMLFVVFCKKRLPSRIMKLYMIHMILLILLNLSGAVCGMVNMGIIQVAPAMQTLWNVFDTIVSYLTMINYLLYLFSLAYLCNFRKKYIYIGMFPMAFLGLVAVVRAMFGAVVWMPVEHGGVPGWIYVASGVLSFFYLVGVTVAIIIYGKRMSIRYRVLIGFMNTVLLAAYVVQALEGVNFRAIGPIAAIILFIHYLAMQSPDFYIDNLTGAFNQSAFAEMLWQNVRYQKKTNCLLVRINDYNTLVRLYEYEHLSYLRRQLAEMLDDTARTSSIYRISSSTYAILGQEADRVKRLYELLLAYLPKRWEIEDEIIPVEYCYYHLQYEGEDVDFEKLTEWVNYARSDHKGHHQPGELIHLEYDIMTEAERQREVLHQIEEAILDQSMEIQMQPVYSMEKQKITSLEVLSRMKDEKQNYINPEYFIHVAENNHRILQLGELIFRRACMFASQNRIFDLGIEYMNVNISPIQCQDEHLTENFVRIAGEFDIPVERIHLEITESEFQDPEAVEHTLARLRKSGMQVALDDFGTGCSTLLGVLELPLDYVKIDKSLVWSYDAGDNRFLDDLMPVIRAEGKKVIAEGIETEDHIEIFRRLKGDFLQGYYFSKPLPEREFVNFVKEFNHIE